MQSRIPLGVIGADGPDDLRQCIEPEGVPARGRHPRVGDGLVPVQVGGHGGQHQLLALQQRLQAPQRLKVQICVDAWHASSTAASEADDDLLPLG